MSRSFDHRTRCKSLSLVSSCADFLGDRGEIADEDDERTMIDLLVDQIEFADTFIFNKVSSTSEADLEAARKVVQSLNSGAVVYETDYSQLPLNDVLGTGRFDFPRAHERPLWYKGLKRFEDHVPGTIEYGIRSFVFRARRPFDMKKFNRLVNEEWPGVVRAKGFFWVSARPDFIGQLSMAGSAV